MANPTSNVDLDYFAYASSKFLNALVWGAVKDYTLNDQAIITFAILEIALRGEGLDAAAYEACVRQFNQQYKLEGKYRREWRVVMLQDMAPKI
jgi:hypothetical protein